MKKLIVLSVIFALVAGSVFAADVSVTVFGKADLFAGSNEEKVDQMKDGKPTYTTKDHVQAGEDIGRIRIDASGATEDGTVGGYLRFEGDDINGSSGGVSAWGYVFYKPADILKITFGSNGYDGFFGLDGVARWNYYQLGGDVGFIPESWKFGESFYGGWHDGGKGGLILTSNPVEALEINIAFPITGSAPAYQKYQRFVIQAKYNLEGLGTAGLTFSNDTLYEHDGSTDNVGGFKLASGTNNDNGKIWAYFGLTSIENLGIDVGIGYQFPDSYYVYDINEPSGGKKNGIESTFTVNNPIALGVAANFSSGALGVKARVQAQFLGNNVQDFTVYTNGDSKSKTYTSDPYGLNMVIDVQPSFAINEKLTAYLSTGVYFVTGEEYVDKYNDDGDPVFAKETRSLVGWHLQPYVVITPSYWNGAFYAGIRLESPQPNPFDGPSGVYYNGEKGDVRNRILNWSIPIGVSFSF